MRLALVMSHESHGPLAIVHCCQPSAGAVFRIISFGLPGGFAAGWPTMPTLFKVVVAETAGRLESV